MRKSRSIRLFLHAFFVVVVWATALQEEEQKIEKPLYAGCDIRWLIESRNIHTNTHTPSRIINIFLVLSFPKRSDYVCLCVNGLFPLSSGCVCVWFLGCRDAFALVSWNEFLGDGGWYSLCHAMKVWVWACRFGRISMLSCTVFFFTGAVAAVFVGAGWFFFLHIQQWFIHIHTIHSVSYILFEFKIHCTKPTVDP